MIDEAIKPVAPARIGDSHRFSRVAVGVERRQAAPLRKPCNLRRVGPFAKHEPGIPKKEMDGARPDRNGSFDLGHWIDGAQRVRKNRNTGGD